MDIPFLKYKKIIYKIWSTIQWEGLDKGIYSSQDMWKYTKYEISEKDSADLRAFEFSAIKKYESINNEIKKIFEGKFISIVNYDEGFVYIITHNDNIVTCNEEKKESDKKHKKRKEPNKIDYKKRAIKSTENILESFPFLHEELMRLYNLGLNDRYLSIKIRKKFLDINFGENRISGWRKINKLPAHKTIGNVCKIDERVEKKFLDFYNQGLNDLEIGIVLGINPGKIAAWRIRNNLKANRKRIKAKINNYI